mgnify:CR=1 FL=1
MIQHTPGPWHVNEGTTGIMSESGLHITDVKAYGELVEVKVEK